MGQHLNSHTTVWPYGRPRSEAAPVPLGLRHSPRQRCRALHIPGPTTGIGTKAAPIRVRPLHPWHRWARGSVAANRWVRLILADVLLLAFWGGIRAPAQAAGNWAYPEPMASWSEATQEGQREAARKLVADLKAALERGEKRFAIPPGDYRFGPKKPENLRLDGVKDFTLEARGVTFWFEARQRIDAVLVNDSARLTLRGLTVDYDSLGHTQGEVVAIDRAGKAFDIRIDPGFPLPEEYGWTQSIGSTKAVFYDPQGRQRDVRMNWLKPLEALGNGVYRCRLTGDYTWDDGSDFRVGDRLTLPERSMRMAFATNRSEAVTFEEITIYASPHMALTEVGGKGGHIYRRCKVVRRPGTRRLLACNADVFHSIQVERGPTIEECEFSHAGDDLVNIHGFFSVVLEQRSPNEVVIVQEFGRGFDTGSELEFSRWGTMEPLGAARAVKVTTLEDPVLVEAAKRLPADARAAGSKLRDFHPRNVWPCLVQLDRPVEVKKLDLVGCEDRMGRGTIIRNSYFHDGFVRGVLLKCRDALVEGNRIERMGINGVCLSAESYWLEGPYPRNVIVRGNTLVECGTRRDSRTWWNAQLGAISVINHAGKGLSPGTQARGIRIEGNTIIRPSGPAIFVSNTRDVTIEGNRIEGAFSKEPVRMGQELGLKDPHYALFLAMCEGVTLKGNQVTAPGPHCVGPVGFGPGIRRESIMGDNYE